MHTRLSSLVLSIVALLLSSCSTQTVVDLPSQNFDQRVKYVVLHYTSQDLEQSIQTLTVPSDYSVSSHYLLTPPQPQKGSQVLRLVEEDKRAWHAGRSYWHGDTELNYTSIGIEIVNQSGCSDTLITLGNSPAFYAACRFEDFPQEQLDTLVALLEDIMARYPQIKPINILGHSDIAPNRKIDPGPTFPWQMLYQQGIGAWYDQADYEAFRAAFATTPATVQQSQEQLQNIGYKIATSGIEDLQSQLVVRAFQARYHPAGMTGFIDLDTAAIIHAIAKKYR